jgi:hypothetical protein
VTILFEWVVNGTTRRLSAVVDLGRARCRDRSRQAEANELARSAQLLGPPRKVTGAQLSWRAHECSVEDYASVMLCSASGILGTVEVGNCFPRDGTDGEWKIAGRDAILTMKDGLMKLATTEGDATLRLRALLHGCAAAIARRLSFLSSFESCSPIRRTAGWPVLDYVASPFSILCTSSLLKIEQHGPRQ